MSVDDRGAPATDPTLLSVAEQGRRMRDGRLAPVALMEATLARIERFDGVLRSFVTVQPDVALRAARVAEHELAAGLDRGPLHGIPFGVKDTIATRGLRTAGGTRVLADHVPETDANVVERLRDAGALLVGKQNLHELGSGGTVDFAFGEPRNPWNPEHIAESSSSGSGSGPAAGFCAFSIGEDTGGSIRGPAAANGVVGLRPTFGRVSRAGVMAHGWNAATIGPLARTVEDVAIVLEAIAGYDAGDPLTSRRPVGALRPASTDTRLDGLRVGLIRDMADDGATHPAVQEAMAEAVRVLGSLGAQIDEVSLPRSRHAVSLQLVTAGDGAPASAAGAWLRERWFDLDVATRTRMAAAALVPAPVFLRAMRARALVREEILATLGHHDVLLCPTAQGPARRVAAAVAAETAARTGADVALIERVFPQRQTSKAFSLANVPALAVPNGFTDDVLPLSMQIVGRPFDEALVFRVGHAYQMATSWHTRHSDLERTVGPYRGEAWAQWQPVTMIREGRAA